MEWLFIFKLGFKSLLAHRLRTFLTIVGVIIGIGSIVFLVSLGFGLQDLVTKQIVRSEAFLMIDVSPGTSSVLKVNKESLSQFKDTDGVMKVEPFVSVPGKIKLGTSVTDGVVFGATSEYYQMVGLKSKKGQILAIQKDSRQVFLTTGALKLLGDRSEVSTLNQTIQVDLIIDKEYLVEATNNLKKENEEFTVAGFVDDSDTSTVYLPLSVIETYGVVNFSGAKLQTQDASKVLGVRKYIESFGYQTDYVGDTLAQINSFFDVFKILLGGFGVVALVVAALGMFNTLTISLMERTREIGLMKALGVKRRDVYRIFLVEALLIGVFGGMVGIVVGWVLSKGINMILNILANRSGGEPATIFITPYWFVITIVVFAFAVGLLTGLYPAKRATRISPLDALRYE